MVAARMAKGTWNPEILKEIEYARSLFCNYYYLGFYYKKNRNYAYKTSFPGLELYDWDNRRWVDFADEYVTEMLEQKLPRKD